MQIAAGSVAEYKDRSEIPASFKWDLSGLFYSDWETWESDLKKAEAQFDEVLKYKGKLSEGPDVLAEMLVTSETAQKVMEKVYAYAMFMKDVDGMNQEAQGRFQQLLGMYGRIGPKLSWITPEILEIPEEKMRAWLDDSSALAEFRFTLEDMYRTASHTLDVEGEKLISFYSPLGRVPQNIYSALCNADVIQPEVTLENGEKFTVSAGAYSTALNTMESAEDRKKVQAAWMNVFDGRKNTIAAVYDGVVKQGWSRAQARGYESVLDAKLDNNNVPIQVVTNLVETARNGANALQRYHHLREKWMGLEGNYGWADAFYPLVDLNETFAYEAIIPRIVDSVGILGEEYQSKLAEQFKAGFVDVFETKGKRSGAYNMGVYGVGSFVLLNYHGNIDDMFTVAHEMGHSMHSRLSIENEPYDTHNYTIFVAEVASIMNEKLLLRKLLAEIKEPRERVAFLEKQIMDIHSTFFLQTMMADYEMRAHELGEKGQGITADKLTELWREVAQAYFGDAIPADDPYMLSWARIPHLYNSPYYVYQYATCYASASTLFKSIQKDPEAVDRYIELLKSGGNDYPMAQLIRAGVDLRKASTVQAVVDEFSQLVNLLEKEYTAYLKAEEEKGS